MKSNILEFIPIGKENAISMSELAIRRGVCKRTARKMVFEERCSGAVICSTCSGDGFDGYYRPASIEEASPFIQMQKNRIRSAKLAMKSAEDFLRGMDNA